MSIYSSVAAFFDYVYYRTATITKYDAHKKPIAEFREDDMPLDILLFVKDLKMKRVCDDGNTTDPNYPIGFVTNFTDVRAAEDIYFAVKEYV